MGSGNSTTLISTTPGDFWKLLDLRLSDLDWTEAIRYAFPTLKGLPVAAKLANPETVLRSVLSEDQLGREHWQLGPAKRLYYDLKPLLPRWLTGFMRRVYQQPASESFHLHWPIEERYAQFQWEVVKQQLIVTGKASAPFVYFWPEGHSYALVLTHDVETAEGQAYIRVVADLEESLGFRSSFNFVPERYPLDHRLMQELRERGFEIGVHGLKHDGKLFRSHQEFSRRVGRINHYLREWNAVGFRAPLTHRNPEWMQALEIEYDLSFFDTDPYEPMPGGTMSLWPFMLGRFVELPYTLVQDHTLTAVLGEKTPALWLRKLDFVRQYSGMALALTHPDYLRDSLTWKIYKEFLETVKVQGGYWHALPREVAAWWRARSRASSVEELPEAVVRSVRLVEDRVVID